MTFGKTTTVALAASAVLLWSAPGVARPTSIRGLAAQEVRLATIAHRIGVASASSCSTDEIFTGIVLHDLTRYDKRIRPAVSRAFSISTGFGVLGVVPGSAAAKAGLRVDDELLAIGSFTLEDRASFDLPKSYRRTDEFHSMVQAASKQGRTDLLVRRAGKDLRLAFVGERGCGGKLALTSSSTLNAWADGKHVVLTTGITDLARNDDEVAFIIAHEMAHNILGHSGDRRASHAFFGGGLSKRKRGEIEADSHAVRLMAEAGYQPTGGLSFLERARGHFGWNFSLDHPGFGRRLRVVAAEIGKSPTKVAFAALSNDVATVDSGR